MSPKSRIHLRRLKRLEICPVCGGYMQPSSFIQGQRVRGRHWKDETYYRSFGGNELKEFACEKCGHTETYQVDDLASIKEDD